MTIRRRFADDAFSRARSEASRPRARDSRVSSAKDASSPIVTREPRAFRRERRTDMYLFVAREPLRERPPYLKKIFVQISRIRRRPGAPETASAVLTQIYSCKYPAYENARARPKPPPPYLQRYSCKYPAYADDRVRPKSKSPPGPRRERSARSTRDRCVANARTSPRCVLAVRPRASARAAWTRERARASITPSRSRRIDVVPNETSVARSSPCRSERDARTRDATARCVFVAVV